MGHKPLGRTENIDAQADDLRRRVERLERRYRLPIGHFNIKCWADRNALDGNLPDEAIVVEAGDGKFLFPITPDLDGSELTLAEAGVSKSGSSDVEVMIVNCGVDPEPLTGTDMLTGEITIPAGDWISWTAGSVAGTTVIDDANSQVESGDWIMVSVVADGTDAEGLVVILRFEFRLRP